MQMKIDLPEGEYLGQAEAIPVKAMAFLCSINCPGSIMIKAQDYANQLVKKNVAVISGFHSPIEKEVLRVLLRGKQPIVIILARSIKGFRIPSEWRPHIDSGRLLVVGSPKNTLNSDAACAKRNELVCGLANSVFIAYATPAGKLEKLAVSLSKIRKPLLTFKDEANTTLIKLGFKPIKDPVHPI